MKKILAFIIVVVLAVGYVIYNEEKIIPAKIRELVLPDSEQVKSDTVTSVSDFSNDTITSTFEYKRHTVVVPMSITNDGSFIKIMVNGIPIKFMIDTGCNTMSLGYIEYMFLRNQGLLSEKPNGDRDVKLADGSIRKFSSIILDSISVGTATFKNIECLVAFPDSSGTIQDVPSLVGFNTFYKFSRVISMNPESGEFIMELK